MKNNRKKYKPRVGTSQSYACRDVKVEEAGIL